MTRRILFVAYDFASRTRGDDGERYTDTRAILSTFGKVVRAHTSGVYRRVTPPDGISLVAPDASDAERRDRETRLQFLIRELPAAHCVVARVDSMDRVMITGLGYAVRIGKPVLLLQEGEPVLFEARDRFKNREHEGIVYRVFRTSKEQETYIVRFMQRVPNGDAIGGVA
ncbi:hypothetical protein EDM68_03400 [Candidatus Uhrbacteria bacterium]|nr:MAG: hypothetical protein EDM68_03400 [Candidatus Uhrbacteria bacterium]